MEFPTADLECEVFEVSTIIVEILHQCILSDQRPVAATIRATQLHQTLVCDNMIKHEKDLNRNKATPQQKLKYQQASKILLSQISRPFFEKLALCDNSICQNQ